MRSRGYYQDAAQFQIPDDESMEILAEDAGEDANRTPGEAR
jgi:hypothetical protein